MLLSSDIQDASPPTPPVLGPLYSFRAQELPLVDALALFARSNKLNIVSGPRDQPGPSPSTLRPAAGTRHVSTVGGPRVLLGTPSGPDPNQAFKTKTLNVDYIRLIRSGTGQNRAQLASGSSGGGGGGGASQDTGQITVNQEDEINFGKNWNNKFRPLCPKRPTSGQPALRNHPDNRSV